MSVIRFRKLFPCRRGQVATYLVVWIAVLVIMGMVLLNVGQVAMVRTATAIAADTAALGLASNLGSLSRKLCANLGTPNCEPKCSDNWEFILHVFLAVILIVIAIVILIVTWGSGFWITVLLISLAVTVVVGTLTALTLQYAVIQPHQVDVFNDMMQDLSIQDQFRETTLFSAFTLVVDDPRQVVDDDPLPRYRDIDRDGDQTEMVGAFAKWWFRRLVQLHQGSGNRRRYAQDLMKIQLPAFRDASRQFRNGFLGRPNHTQSDASFIGMLDWLENQGLPVTFWQPGFQGPIMPRASIVHSTSIVPCTPGLACAPPPLPPLLDDVDWVNGEIPGNPDGAIDGSLKAFETFIDRLSPLRLRRLVKSANQWGSLLRSYWANNANWWSQFLQKWIDELRITESTMCARYGLAPGCTLPPPPAGPPAFPVPAGFANPVQWAIDRLTAFKATVDVLSVQITAGVVRGISREHPIYKWSDSRGWHMVKVDVPDFEVPTATADQGLVFAHQGAPECILTGGACMQTCVAIVPREGDITVRVTRLDQDRQLNRGWNYRVRDRVQSSTQSFQWDTMDAESPAGRAYWRDILRDYGITSTAVAHYGFTRRSVQLRRVK